MPNKTGTTHWLEREDFGEVTVVRLKPPKALDEDTIRAIFDPIYSLASDMGRNNLVLNLAAVDHLPSMALGKLVMLNRKVQAANGRPGALPTLSYRQRNPRNHSSWRFD